MDIKDYFSKKARASKPRNNNIISESNNLNLDSQSVVPSKKAKTIPIVVDTSNNDATDEPFNKEPENNMSHDDLSLVQSTSKKPSENIEMTVIEGLQKDQPIRPMLASFPKRRFGNERFDRHFKSEWYKGRDWLEYIEEIDACLCFPCRLLSPHPDSTFVTKGFRDWKHALQSGKNVNLNQTTKNLNGT